MSRTMRTNAPYPVIHTTRSRWSDRHSRNHRQNLILAYYRDIHSDAEDVRELLWATQVLRLAYDSPRIGGGIDPEIASNVTSLNTEREDGRLIPYLCDNAEDAKEEWISKMRELSQELPFSAQEIQALGITNPEEYIAAFYGVDVITIQDWITHAEAVALKWLAVYGEE